MIRGQIRTGAVVAQVHRRLIHPRRERRFQTCGFHHRGREIRGKELVLGRLTWRDALRFAAWSVDVLRAPATGGTGCEHLLHFWASVPLSFGTKRTVNQVGEAAAVF